MNVLFHFFQQLVVHFFVLFVVFFPGIYSIINSKKKEKNFFYTFLRLFQLITNFSIIHFNIFKFAYFFLNRWKPLFVYFHLYFYHFIYLIICCIVSFVFTKWFSLILFKCIPIVHLAFILCNSSVTFFDGCQRLWYCLWWWNFFLLSSSLVFFFFLFAFWSFNCPFLWHLRLSKIS